MLDNLQKRVCRTDGPTLDAFLEPLGHHGDVASVSLFYRYYFARCLSKLAEMLPIAYSCEKSDRYSDIMMFLSAFLDVSRMSLSMVPFLAQIDSWILYLENAFLQPII